MIYDEDNELDPLKSSMSTRCTRHGCTNRASWKTSSVDGGDPVDMCGRCVLYGGSSWGNQRRDEIVTVGRTARAFAKSNAAFKKDVHIPEIDDRGRLSAEDADRFLIGVKRTTALIQSGPLGSVVRRILGEE